MTAADATLPPAQAPGAEVLNGFSAPDGTPDRPGIKPDLTDGQLKSVAEALSNATGFHPAVKPGNRYEQLAAEAYESDAATLTEAVALSVTDTLGWIQDQAAAGRPLSEVGETVAVWARGRSDEMLKAAGSVHAGEPVQLTPVAGTDQWLAERKQELAGRKAEWAEREQRLADGQEPLADILHSSEADGDAVADALEDVYGPGPEPTAEQLQTLNDKRAGIMQDALTGLSRGVSAGTVLEVIEEREYWAQERIKLDDNYSVGEWSAQNPSPRLLEKPHELSGLVEAILPQAVIETGWDGNNQQLRELIAESRPAILKRYVHQLEIAVLDEADAYAAARGLGKSEEEAGEAEADQGENARAAARDAVYAAGVKLAGERETS